MKGGLDNYPGYDCLSLGIWDDRDNNTGGDGSQARIYQRVSLTAGRYFFGAIYQNTWNLNDQAYIFAASSTLASADIPSKAISWAAIQDQPEADSQTHGLSFTLDSDQEVVLGFQSNLLNGSTEQDLRIEEVQLISYGNLSAESLNNLGDEIQEALQDYIVSDNTGYTDPTIYATADSLSQLAQTISSSATTDELQQLNDQLTAAYDNLVNNGRLRADQGFSSDYTDVTAQYLGESKEFSRTESGSTTRYAAPLYWTVENYSIRTTYDGTRAGLDSNPGYDCLSLGIWQDAMNAESGIDLSQARIYQTLTLPAGRYYFGSRYNTIYNLSQAYMFASSKSLDYYEVETEAIAWAPISECSDDGQFWGITFTLDSEQTIMLGFQANFNTGDDCQEFRAREVALWSDDTATAIDGVSADTATVQLGQTARYYSLSGMPLSKAPDKGIYLVRKGDRFIKVIR